MLLTNDVRATLEENGRRQRAIKGTLNKIDFVPVVKLFTPLANSMWLLTEINPNDVDKAFGLQDLGDGDPALRYISLTELESRFGHASVRQDKSFQGNEPLSDYAKKAGLVT